MSNKFFGQFLLEKGLINKTQLLTAIDIQKIANPTLGQIAIQKGYLSESTASKVNAEQQRTDNRFGDLSVSMGFMTEEQVEEVFQTQKKGRKFFGEILVEQEFLSQETVAAELAKHAKEKEALVIEFDEAITSHPYAELLSGTLDIVSKMFLRVPKIQLQVAGVMDDKLVLNSQQHACSQTMYLPEAVKVGWVMEDDLMIAIANGFLGMDVSDEPLVYKDAVSEFLNIVLGNMLAHRKDQQTRLEPPQFNEVGEDYLAPFKENFHITISTPEQDFIIFMAHD
mgnify:CR=1 FL=1